MNKRAMDTAKKGKFVGLHYRPDQGLLVCSAESGMLQQWSAKALEEHGDSREKALEPDVTTQLAVPINVARLEPGALRLAYGGKENDVKLWDVEAKKLAWSAKNVWGSLSLSL